MTRRASSLSTRLQASASSFRRLVPSSFMSLPARPSIPCSMISRPTSSPATSSSTPATRTGATRSAATIASPRAAFRYVDLGTSGGIRRRAREGRGFMAGGDQDAIARIEPILLDLAVEGGYVNAVRPARTLRQARPQRHRVRHASGHRRRRRSCSSGSTRSCPVAECSLLSPRVVVRSWLVDLMEEAYRAQGGMDDGPGIRRGHGRVNWLVGDALRMEVPIPVIAQSVMHALFASRDDRKSWARAIAMMRHGFGGHPFGPHEPEQRERREGRVGDFYRPRRAVRRRRSGACRPRLASGRPSSPSTRAARSCDEPGWEHHGRQRRGPVRERHPLRQPLGNLRQR
jgi:hypothetical protein